jgi:two-component system sensor histidine kinase HydH
MDLLGQSALLVGVTSFALGFSVLARNVRNKLFITYSVLTTIISLWALMFTLDRIWPEYGLYRWHLFFNLWLAPASLLFINSFVRTRDAFARRLFDVTLVSALCLTLCLGLGLDSNLWISRAIYFIPGTVYLLILRMMATRRNTTPTVGLGRRNLIYIGGVLVVSMAVLDHVPWMGRIVPSIGNFALIIYLFFMSQAITQQRFLNIEALISRFLVLLVLAATLTGFYSILVGWIHNSPPLFFLNSFIASFLIIMLLDPIRTLVRYSTERLLTQKHLLIQQTLKEAQRKLVGTVEVGVLFEDIIRTSTEILHPEWGALFMLRSDGTKYRRLRTFEESTTEDTERFYSHLKEMIADHPLMEYCMELHRKGRLPILLDQIIESEMDRSASRTQREHLSSLIEALRALGCNLLIPLFDSGKILGFVALRVTAPPEPWGNNWGVLPIIYPYYEQAANTLRGMEVFVRQREKERLAALGEMAAGLAHEIRNPLGAIKGAAQFLDPTANKPESKFLQIIIEEVDRLNRVVTQFLDYSKPPNPDMSPVDLSELARITVEKSQLSVDASKVKLSFQPSKQKAQVMAAPEQLQQVLINLIQNSVKALDPQKEGTIEVSLEVDDSALPSGEILLMVFDNGKGIKKEHVDKLFIPFFTTSPSGTGLGLSISQKIIEAHRGRIEVATEEGKFSRFSIVLPQLKQEGNTL